VTSRARSAHPNAMPRNTASVFVKRHLVVLHDLDEVAPRVAKFEPPNGRDLGTRLLERAPRRLLVVDDESELTVRVGLLRAALRERDELVAHVDEGDPG
jgi:hypothetical protein